MWSWFERLINPFPQEAVENPPTQFFTFMWSSTKGLRPYLFLMILATATVGFFEGILFGFLDRLVNWMGAYTPQTLWHEKGQDIALFFGLILAGLSLMGVQAIIKHQILEANFAMMLRWRFHRLMLNQSMRFYQDEYAGRVASKVMQTAMSVRDVWRILTDIVVFVVIYFVTMIAVAWDLDGWLTWPFLLWLVLYACVLSYFVPRVGKLSSIQSDARAMMTGRISDAYSNITTVKLFSHSGREANYAKESMHSYLKTVWKQLRLITGIELINNALSVGLILSTAGVAVWLYIQGQAGIGAVAATTAMALRLNGISHWIMWEMSSLFEHLGTVQDGVKMLTKISTVQDEPQASPLVINSGEIVFDRVNFYYEPEKPVIESLNIRIAPGEKVGLVGRSGAGKSTLLQLLLRFYDANSGEIRIDGQPIKKITQDSLRRQIAMVTQDTSLLHRSIGDNIRYGREEATEDEVRQAARLAHAHEFIEALNDPYGKSGYEALVGERGIKLSGGQRQRIAIARVILKNAPILLLDEATSALDSEIEASIQLSLYDLMRGKTVIAIAHRLSTIMAMDRLLVMDKGVIVEEGTHSELLMKEGLYHRLWSRQMGGFITPD